MKKVLCGNEMDKMPGWAFRIMAFMFNIMDIFKSPDKKLDPFHIQKGQTVIDYGCGTGRYIPQASGLVGENGLVYAVDIHELAVEAAHNIANKLGLRNVRPIQTDGKSVSIPDQSADVIYALDMFHMVKDTNAFLTELNRLTKPGGFLFLEDGHQKRTDSRKKVIDSGCWEIFEETKAYMKLRSKNSN